MRVSGQAWLTRWLQHPELRPIPEDGEPTPIGWGFRLLGDGDQIEFWVQHQLDDAQPIETTTRRTAAELGLRITDAGGLEPIETGTLS